MTNLIDGSAITIIPTRFAVQAAPDSNSPALATLRAATVRTLVTYAGSVTAVTLRLWIRNSRTGTWHRGASSADSGSLTPGSDGESIDWHVGKNSECTFTVEAISPGTSGNTVTVDAVGVE